jgi:hypothetical protein
MGQTWSIETDATQTQPSAYDQRVRELYRMPKSRLAPLWRQHHPNAWTAHPVEKWNKDELINDILRAEFPTVGA